jgi:glutamate decarboxylase
LSLRRFHHRRSNYHKTESRSYLQAAGATTIRRLREKAGHLPRAGPTGARPERSSRAIIRESRRASRRNPDQRQEPSMHELNLASDEQISPTYAARSFSHPIPKYKLPAQGLSSQAAYRLVSDELELDGIPGLNLASFVTSWMEPQADVLAAQTLGKNLIDQDEYPRTAAIHERVITMIARLFNAPQDEHPMGTATVGSSEAIMLAMLAHKRRWQLRRRDAGEDAQRPNVVMGADVHTVWEKFARYFELEARVIPMEDRRYTIGAAQVEPLLDERTIGVAGLLGTTFTGQMDDLQSIDELLQRVNSEHGWQIPMHIDAASGGFLIPFSQPDMAWDFRLPSVHSINVSNHKFGLVYPGMGTVIFRRQDDVPDELIFHINYLGGDMPNYSLNFSRPSDSVLLQYYNFLRLGHEGYERIVTTCLENAQALAHQLARIEGLELVNDGSVFPIVAVRAAADADTPLDLTRMSFILRERGWIVPAYALPANAEHITLLRMVIKESFSREMADLLAHDMRLAADALRHGGSIYPQRARRRALC